MKIQLENEMITTNGKYGKWSVYGDSNDIIFSGTAKECIKFWKASAFYLRLKKIDKTVL